MYFSRLIHSQLSLYKIPTLDIFLYVQIFKYIFIDKQFAFHIQIPAHSRPLSEGGGTFCPIDLQHIQFYFKGKKFLNYFLCGFLMGFNS
jgi:hypothetical protein